MRISLVISSLNAGGAERVMTTLANAWVARGWQVDLFTTHDAGRAPHYPLSPAVGLRSVDPRLPSPFRQAATVRNLRAAIRAARPDVVVSFLNYTNIMTLAACRGLTCPVIISERLDPRVIPIGRAWSLLRRLTYPWATLLVAQTSTAAELYGALTGGRVRVIPNPVHTPAQRPADPASPVAADRRTILCVGRLQKQKGFDIALRAMSLLGPACADWRLVILGEGPERPNLERLRDELELGDRARLAGQVADTWPWLRQAGIFLMSSRSEGFPNALTEAMAAGLPVISTDCPSGPADIITPGADGLLAPTEDPAALAEALARLIGSEELRTRFAQAAPGVLERYSLDSVLVAWDRVFEESTGTAGEPGKLGGNRP
jgi:GalNAc-alpha-(1->4)-GalNAc-alpha-(1->3)-diNAcBac-PP-undecaprenol alpha-1,4-N-acetyl-D-galactosaminyltransferase